MEIEQNIQYLIEHLLDNKFDWTAFGEETLTGLGLDIVRTKTNAQQLIGKLAMAQDRLPRNKRSSLKEFAKAIQVSVGSLRGYKSVEERLEGIELPADINWGARLVIARQKDPVEVAEHIKEDGLSSAMVVKLYGGVKEEHKKVLCPNCKKLIEL